VLTLAGCLLLDEKGRILLIHRNTPKRVQWELPGGKIAEAEDPTQAAIREVREELGVTVEIVRDLGGQVFTEDDHKMHYYWFLGVIIDGEPRLLEEAYDDLRYFTWDELRVREDLSPNTRNLITAYLHGVIDTSPHSKQRRMRNEQVIKQANEHTRELAGRLLDTEAKTFLPLAFICECSDRDCTATLELSSDEYMVAHQYPDQFIIKPGHEHLDIERILSTLPDASEPAYCIVEKYTLGQQRRDVTK
jgi:8-oxo-dGTP diphosphatase